MNNRFEVQLLGREQWKTRLQWEPRLSAEKAVRARAGAIGFKLPFLKHQPKQIEILDHRRKSLSSDFPSQKFKHGEPTKICSQTGERILKPALLCDL
jgi:hypothetical protein